MSKSKFDKLFYSLTADERVDFVIELCHRYGSLVCKILQEKNKCRKIRGHGNAINKKVSN